MAQYNCPDCGKPLHTIQTQGITLLKCQCGYGKNLQTGEEVRMDPDAVNCVVVCGNCGGKNRLYYKQNGPTGTCGFCKHSIRIPARKDPNLALIVQCSHCSGKNRVPANNGKVKVKCGHCSQFFMYNSGTWPGLLKTPATPSAPSRPTRPESSYTTVQCPKCGEAYRFPDNCGDIKHQCSCGRTIYYKGTSNEKLAKQPQPAPQPKPAAPTRPQPAPQPKPAAPTRPQPAPQPKPAPCRTLTLRRATHAYKEIDFHGLQNAVKDKLPVTVYLDDEAQFKLAAQEEKFLRMDSREHTLHSGLLSSKYRIPSGTDDYTAIFFEGGYRIGPDRDEFRDRLTEILLQMFRGPGIRERIQDSNNSGNKIYMDINKKGIRIYWRLKETKGLWQSLIGEKEEKLSYGQLGLTPPPEDRLPESYWGFIRWWVEDAILADESNDIGYNGGGFILGKSHGLL